MQTKTFPIILENTRMLSPSVKHFIFNSSQNQAFNYLPGQFITVHFEHQDKILRRSYSIANTPTNDNRIEFAASYVQNGPGTEFLFNLKPGDTIQITGPFGRLTLKDEIPKRYILMSTSTGITPYRSMQDVLQQMLNTNLELSIVILQGVQKREDILYGDEFLAWAAQSPRVSFRAHLSREQDNNLLPHEYKGHIQSSFSELKLNPEEDIVYLCGNPAMIDEAFALLKDSGFSTQQVIREKYISSK